MNKLSSRTTNEYNHKSYSNPSLITVGLPSSSIMTSRLIPPSLTTKQNHYLNQNRATDTQPISLNSQKNDTNQSITLSHRTISDTYLNLSRKDIDDLMTSLCILAKYVQNDLDCNNQISMDDNETHPLTMFQSKSTNHTIKNSIKTNTPYHPRYLIRNKRRSLSSDRCLNHHNVISRMYFHPVEKRLHQLQYYQNSYSYPSTHDESNIQSRQTYCCSQQCQLTKNLSSPISLSSYILDKFISIDQNKPISNLQMLPQQVHTLQILQNSHMHSFMSIDSLNTKDPLRTTIKPCRSQKLNHIQTSNINKIDVATQWSLQMLTPRSIPSSASQEHTTILTELSQSRTTIATNNSAINTSLISKAQSFMNTSSIINDQSNIKIITDTNDDLTKSETERFLTSLNLPTCKCLNTKLRTRNTNVKHSLMDDTITSISFDNNIDDLFSTSLHKKKTKPTSIKLVSKRPRHHTSKSSRNNPSTNKRSRFHHHSPSNNRLMTMIQSLKTTDLQDDSSFDFFDIDTTFSDTYDRLFSDTIISEKYIY